MVLRNSDMMHFAHLQAARTAGARGALRYALDHPALEAVTAIEGGSSASRPPKLKKVLHPHFADRSALADAFLGQDAAVWLSR
jgi:hypothetical protein